MADKDRTGDVDARIRGLGAEDPDLLAEDVCVEENRLCVESVFAGIKIPDGGARVTFEAIPLAIGTFTVNNRLVAVGQRLIIFQLTTGSEEDSVGGNKCELWWEPDANPANDVNITRHYISGGNNFEEGIFFESAVGDGINQVSLRRERFGGGTAEVYAVFRGYEIV